MKIHNPEEVGMSAERVNRIAPIMEDFVKDNRLPGVMTLLQRRGKVVHVGKYGLMDIEAGKPIQEDSLFRIYSMTKPIVSVALMMLYEEGRFSLTDPVSKFIPAFAKTKVYAGAGVKGMKLVEQDPPMTLYHLLTHTAGLSYGSHFDTPVDEVYRQSVPHAPAPWNRAESLDKFIELLATLPLVFQPGSQWRYSSAVDVIGYVIQVVSGMSLPDFLEQRIFKPLGMTDTAFYVPPEKVNRLAQLYTSKALYDPQPVPVGSLPPVGDVTIPTQSPFGGGGLVSTLPDYLSFCNCLLNNGAYDGGRLISRKTLAWMTANHLPEAWLPISIGDSVKDYGFGMGFRTLTALSKARVLNSVGEFGWSGLAYTYFWVDPAEEFIGLFMTQYLPTDDYPVQERFRVLAYQAIAD